MFTTCEYRTWYEFNELNEEAKERAARWYADSVYSCDYADGLVSEILNSIKNFCRIFDGNIDWRMTYDSGCSPIGFFTGEDSINAEDFEFNAFVCNVIWCDYDISAYYLLAINKHYRKVLFARDVVRCMLAHDVDIWSDVYASACDNFTSAINDFLDTMAKLINALIDAEIEYAHSTDYAMEWLAETSGDDFVFSSSGRDHLFVSDVVTITIH